MGLVLLCIFLIAFFIATLVATITLIYIKPKGSTPLFSGIIITILLITYTIVSISNISSFSEVRTFELMRFYTVILAISPGIGMITSSIIFLFITNK